MSFNTIECKCEKAYFFDHPVKWPRDHFCDIAKGCR